MDDGRHSVCRQRKSCARSTKINKCAGAQKNANFGVFCRLRKRAKNFSGLGVGPAKTQNCETQDILRWWRRTPILRAFVPKKSVRSWGRQFAKRQMCVTQKCFPQMCAGAKLSRPAHFSRSGCPLLGHLPRAKYCKQHSRSL